MYTSVLGAEGCLLVAFVVQRIWDEGPVAKRTPAESIAWQRLEALLGGKGAVGIALRLEASLCSNLLLALRHLRRTLCDRKRKCMTN